MSFTQEIKQELLNREFTIKQAQAFISGIITSAGVREGSKYIVKFNRSTISHLVRDMISQMKIEHESLKDNKNWVIFKKFSLTQNIDLPGDYFAGVFLGGGSISDPGTASYHLEIQFYSHQAALKVQSFLNKYAFNFTLIQRRVNHVLYLKKAEQISDFLKAIQAFKSLMIFEDARIQRDFTNQLNRYSNLDIYNQQKLAKASTSFKKKFDFIKTNNLMHLFRKQEMDFFEIKIKNPYLSLEQLAILYKKKTSVIKTKSGLNHYLIKLRKVYEKYKAST